jgi:hypothetical protein
MRFPYEILWRGWASRAWAIAYHVSLSPARRDEFRCVVHAPDALQFALAGF